MNDETNKKRQDSSPTQRTESSQDRVIQDAMLAVKNTAEEFYRKLVREKRWTMTKRIFWCTLIAVVVIGYGATIFSAFHPEKMGNQPVASVALIPIHGEIANGRQTDADHINPLIKKACDDKNVKAIVLDIDSPGGSPTEANRIITQINQCKKAHPKKKVDSLISEMAASAAYMIAIHTDKIYAGKFAMVGSIGALITYFDASDLAERLGIHQQIIRTRPLKGGPSMWTPTTAEDTKVNKEMVDAAGKLFLADVIKSRGDKLHADTQTLYSGRMWIAEKALKMGLIDQIAVLEDLKAGVFKGLKFVPYSHKTGLERILNTKAIVHQVMDSLTKVRLQ